MRCVIVWIASLWFVAACVGASAVAERAEEATRQRLEAAQRTLPEGAEDAEGLTRQLLDGPDAASLSPSLQRSATHVLAAALKDQGRCAEVLPMAEQALTSPQPSARDWRFALALNYECGDYARAAALLSNIRQIQPNDIAGLPGQVVFRAAILSDDADLLAFMVGGGWTPREPATDMSELRLALIRAHLARGDQSAAASAARDLVDTVSADFGAVVVLLSDRTFDPIVSADTARFSFPQIAERLVENAFARYAAHPDRLTVLNSLVSTLHGLGRMDEALLLVDDALARIEAAGPESPPFTDLEQALNWTYNLRANLRRYRGLEAEALADLERGAAQSEGGRINVSQRLNRAGMLLAQQRAEEALAQAQDVDLAHLSPYGRSVRRQLIVCAHAQLGRAEQMREALAEAVAHGSDSYMNLQAAAECANDLDLAADALKRRLESPAERRGVLIEIQGFAGEPPPREWLDEHRVFSRADVQAAIEGAAHIRTFPITRPY